MSEKTAEWNVEINGDTTVSVEPVKNQCVPDCGLEFGLQGEEQQVQKALKYRPIRVV